MARMQLAVLDAAGNTVHAWDSARLGRETLAQLIAGSQESVETSGRWPFRRTTSQTTEISLEEAADRALRAFLREAARA